MTQWGEWLSDLALASSKPEHSQQATVDFQFSAIARATIDSKIIKNSSYQFCPAKKYKAWWPCFYIVSSCEKRRTSQRMLASAPRGSREVVWNLWCSDVFPSLLRWFYLRTSVSIESNWGNLPKPECESKHQIAWVSMDSWLVQLPKIPNGWTPAAQRVAVRTDFLAAALFRDKNGASNFRWVFFHLFSIQ